MSSLLHSSWGWPTNYHNPGLFIFAPLPVTARRLSRWFYTAARPGDRRCSGAGGVESGGRTRSAQSCQSSKSAVMSESWSVWVGWASCTISTRREKHWHIQIMLVRSQFAIPAMIFVSFFLTFLLWSLNNTRPHGKRTPLGESQQPAWITWSHFD